jgi:hypothetical protein
MFHHAALRLLFVRGAPDPAGHGQIVAHFFDSGLSRTLAWAPPARRRDQVPY